MKSLVLPKTTPGAADEAWDDVRTDIDTAVARPNPATPGPLASFARFVLLGGGVGVASSGAVVELAGLMPWVVANALVTVASTLLSTELHARFTFGTGHAGWRQHWQSAGSATAAYAVTSIAVLVLHLVQPSAGALYEQVVYLTAAGLSGVGRFLVLRVFVFAGGRTRPAVRAMSPAPARETGAKVSLLFPVPAL
ncbi:hypothetical protein [Streptomyces sp. NBC_01314]|uniref:hypothetical protein n=1 Tax=Streptomyces sp. NBC_01314 TaxID=2903821 RepID=UPI003087EC3D|nr:GtrA family protein [Streptomyces sp. NBC_01314]